MKSFPVPLFRIEGGGGRWTARVLTVFLLGLVVVMLVGVTLDGGFHPLKLKGVEPIQMIFFWAACIGMAVAGTSQRSGLAHSKERG